MLELLIAILFLQIVLGLMLILKKSGGLGEEGNTRITNVENLIEKLERSIREESGQSRERASTDFREQREELSARLKEVADSLAKNISDNSAQQVTHLGKLTESNSTKLTEITTQSNEQARLNREELATSLKRVVDSNEKKIEDLKTTIDKRLETLQVKNEEKLEQMRVTVDEKLQGTLEKRLGESFKLVSERLELVHKGLGEMQSLATGVGDLKKVLTNVKTRGIWGEVILQNLLEEMLTPAQFSKNVKTNSSSNDLVEFVINLPGNSDEVVWLPIDSKFPSEDYQRLVEAHDNADLEGIEAAGKMLETRVKACAKDISSKYLNPPKTTDYGIMFLPTEGLYAEVARRGSLLETIQRDYRILVAGPATFAALLNSLQMGFRTVAIEKRSSEIWKTLGQVKTEFTKFGDALDSVKKKLESASNSIDETSKRSRAIERKLKDVEELPTNEIDTRELTLD